MRYLSKNTVIYPNTVNTMSAWNVASVMLTIPVSYIYIYIHTGNGLSHPLKSHVRTGHNLLPLRCSFHTTVMLSYTINLESCIFFEDLLISISGDSVACSLQVCAPWIL